MADNQKNFKVRHGLTVGEEKLTVDAATGNLITLGDVSVGGGELTIASPGYIYSGTNLALTVSDNDVFVAGDLTVTGNQIKSSTGTPITIAGDDVNIQGQLRVTGDTIRKSGGNSVLTFSGTNATTTAGDLTVTGDLTVNGTTTTLNTETLLVEDNIVTLNSNVTGTPAANAGIEIERGTETNSSLLWVETDDKWYQNRAGTSTVIPVSTAELTENTNLYYTDARARAALSGGTGVSYNNTTGAISIGQAVGTTDDVQFDDVIAGSLTVDNININGNTIISTDTNGNITLTPNGTGDVVTTKNIVRGAIRNATADTNGLVWYLNTSSLTAGYSGISVDNSPSTASQSALIVRNYTGNNTAASIGSRGRLVFEKARNTVASPAAVAIGDLLGEVAATGYTSTGWINDQYSAVPAFFGFTAAENWVANTNIGSSFNLTLAPTATTVASNANLVTVISANPQLLALRTDQFALSRGKTAAFTATGCSISGGTTLTIGTVTSGTVAVGQTLVLTSAGTAINSMAYIVSGSGSTWTLSASTGNLTNASISGFTGFLGSTAAATTVDMLATPRLLTNALSSVNDSIRVEASGRVTFRDTGSNSILYNNFSYIPGAQNGGNGNVLNLGNTNHNNNPGNSPGFNLVNYRSTDGVNFTPTQSGDWLGVYNFYGNVATGTTPDNGAGHASDITIYATENWTPGAQGSKISLNSIKAGTTNFIRTADIAPENITLQADTYSLKSSSGTVYASMNSTSATFAQPVGFPVKTASQWNAITGVLGQQVCVSDSAQGSNPNGMMAFWDTTNTRWSYIHDNSAV